MHIMDSSRSHRRRRRRRCAAGGRRRLSVVPLVLILRAHTAGYYSSRSRRRRRRRRLRRRNESADSSCCAPVDGRRRLSAFVPNSNSSSAHKCWQIKDNHFRDLARPLATSLASIIHQILDGKISLQGRIQADYLSHICTSAVKEYANNIDDERLDSFIKYFGMSFGSTLKTLRKISDISINQSESALTVCSPSTSNDSDRSVNYINDSSSVSYKNSRSAPTENSFDIARINEDIQENATTNSVNNQIIIHGQRLQRLDHASHILPHSQLSRSFLNACERSASEQSRSQDLKAFELDVVGDKLKLKQTRLSIASDANKLKDMRTELGMSKVSFKEEKLINKVEHMRHAQLLRTFGDILITGLIIMCCMLAYGAYAFSYQRIMNLLSPCTPPDQVNKSWWIPKQTATFWPTWQSMKCHASAMRSMFTGVPIVSALAYLLLRRSISHEATPMTFTIVMLGVICGFAGWLCVDALGGNGYMWLLPWELNCMIHLLATMFPAAYYRLLYGHGSGETRRVLSLPYTVARYVLYVMLLLVCPAWIGLSPFASFHVWKEHFSNKLLGSN